MAIMLHNTGEFDPRCLNGNSRGYHDELQGFLKGAGSKLVVIKFSARWCGPCKMIHPAFQAMSLKYPNVKFGHVDVDDSPELSQEYHIKILPTFQMFKQTQKPGELFIGEMVIDQTTQINHEILYPHLGDHILKTPETMLLLQKWKGDQAGNDGRMSSESL
ncbi:PREDICTED: thioredoxin domain-containing protein 2-like [Elephantulus edwardii]|uniref:thioredoxin domain-containing protein 2-like n=1 Tax=Elephantulus edwardii TaxID=28737 RepID=UPI0003F0E790|nr:PREDICTED: thioredoxin domain-containing protein 2-like [Elephantulus edwardii]